MTLNLARLASGVFAFAGLAAGSAFGQLTLLDQPPSQVTTLYAQIGLESNTDQFVLTEGAIVEEFSIWGTWVPSGFQNSDTFDVYFRDNGAGDTPGDIVATYLALSPTVTVTGLQTGGVAGGGPEYQLDFVLPSGMQLAPGTHWIEMYSTGSSGSGDDFAWEMAPEDLLRGGPCMAWAVQTPGVTWNTCTPLPETDLALLLLGSPDEPGAAFCFGDGTGTSCPCGNTGAAGNGCANGTHAGGANLAGTGFADTSGDSLTLAGSGSPANQPGLFFQGDNALNGGSGIVFGDGLRCAGMNVVRLETVSADANGDSSTSVSISVEGMVSSGDTKHYQLWYRDPLGSPCGALFNFSNGYSITWQ